MNEKLKEKLLSGRYFCTVMVITTLCLMIITFCILVGIGKMKLDVFLASTGGFFVIATRIIDGYFDRKDRKQEG